MGNALGEMVGWTPFDCDLCMATGPAADPCPWHNNQTWAEWLVDAFKRYAWGIMHAARVPRHG